MNGKNIDPERITSAPIETGNSPTVPVGNDPFTRDPILDQKMGLVGKIFGYGESAHVNIAGITLVVFILLLFGSVTGVVFAGDAEVRKFLSSMITPIFGVITGLIGFVIGKKDK
jgi:hypothetical protein